MTDELLPYYEKELAFIRQMGAEFAHEHPKIAGRLGIGTDTIEDPHVSRLIESFAYLNARIQHKLDDDFPELSDALLEVLFPHYQRPIPSMSIVQFQADSEKLDGTYTLQRNTLLDTEPFQGETCRFATAYETTLHPFTLSHAALLSRPFNTPGSQRLKNAAGVLRLSFTTFKEQNSFAAVRPNKIRLYLKGQPQHINPLYEMLLKECSAVFIASGEADTHAMLLPPDTIKPVGFAENEGLLPYPDASFIGYRLLTEYFIFPEKFMFIDIDIPPEALPPHVSDTLELYIYFNRSDMELERNVSTEMFQMGCTPVVNLFPHRIDPIKVQHTETEYHVLPDLRRPTGYEVYAIQEVVASSSTGEKETYPPLYGLDHAEQDNAHRAYWFARRRPAKSGTYPRDDGSDVFLSLVDLHLNPNNPDDRTLNIRALCSNRDQPAKLPFSAHHPKLLCVDQAPPCTRIRCVTQPTPAVRPAMGNGARWRLLSHLNLNHLSLTGRGGDATNALKEILRLYDFKETAANRAQIESLSRITTRPITAPLTIGGRTAMCRGTEITVDIDDSQLSGNSVYLFASVLEHFFALYCSLNSFTRLRVKRTNSEGYLKVCPPRSGEKVLL